MSDPGEPTVPHLAWPLRLARHGGLVAVEQDTVEDVRQCVAVLVRTDRGSRPLAPDLGVDDPTFGPGVVASLLERDIETQEDRASAEVIASELPFGEQSVQVRVRLAGEEPVEGLDS